MISPNNKFLKLESDVVLTAKIDPVIAALDPYFEKAGIHAVVTSGFRDANKQLSVIRSYLKRHGLDKKYPHALNCKVTDEVNGEYAWQMAWSNLLNIGVIINPPLDAKCLMPYKGKVGTLIRQSPHSRGTAFDVGGGKQYAKILAVIKQAEGKVKGLVKIVPEPVNNAIHIDCR